METELFGEESSAEEDESSDESDSDAVVQGQGGDDSSPSVSEGHAELEVVRVGQQEGGEMQEGEVGGTPGYQQEEPSDSQFPNTQDLFGASSSSSSSSEEEEESVGGEGSHSHSSSPIPPSVTPVHSPLSMTEGEEGLGLGLNDSSTSAVPGQDQQRRQTVEGIFGDAHDISSSDDDMAVGGVERTEEGMEGAERAGGEERGEQEEVPRINVEIPRCTAHLGSELFFVKLPNFLSVETRPFDPSLYEDEGEEDDVLDEEGRARLKLKVENTIRWRYSQDESGNEIRESNARIVRWSDGTMSLYLGNEIFDIYKQQLLGEFSHLFVRQGTGLQGQAVFRTKLSFRPHSTDSQTHRKMTLSIADKFSKKQKIRVLPVMSKDPESQRTEKIKKEEEKLRAAIRRENQQRRVRERHSQRGLTANFLEPDRLSDGEEEGGVSLTAIKSSVRSQLSRGGGRGGGGGGEWSGSDAESSDEGAERLLRAKDVVQEERGSAKKPPVKKGRKLMLSSDEESD